MMTKLLMTRVECANQIERVASNLRYHVDRVAYLVEYEDRDQKEELSQEIDIRQDLNTLEYLLRVIEDQI